MKKLVLFMTMAAAVAFTSCSKDDDDNSCESCEAQGEKIEICDNGDGTYSMTGSDETISKEELDASGFTSKQLVELTCALANGDQ